MKKTRETRGELERRFCTTARKMTFTNDSAKWFCEQATTGQLCAVCDLVEHELAVRENNKRAKLLRAAKFSAIKSMDDFDFSDVVFPAGYTKENLVGLDFVDKAQDFVFYGASGRGKTHCSIALGVMAIARCQSVRFFEAADLVLQLKTAEEKGVLDKMLDGIKRADVLIIDEFGYIPIDVEGARLLYQVMAATYERQSMIITTNIEFGKWGTVLADDHLAGALCDRSFQHGRLIEFKGESKRLNNALMTGKGED